MCLFILYNYSFQEILIVGKWHWLQFMSRDHMHCFWHTHIPILLLYTVITRRELWNCKDGYLPWYMCMTAQTSHPPFLFDILNIEIKILEHNDSKIEKTKSHLVD